MNREDINKITLGKGELSDLSTNEPRKFPVLGLPRHLSCEIDLAPFGGWRYHLRREGDQQEYTVTSNGPSSPESALEALKRLLTWEPIR